MPKRRLKTDFPWSNGNPFRRPAFFDGPTYHPHYNVMYGGWPRYYENMPFCFRYKVRHVNR